MGLGLSRNPSSFLGFGFCSWAEDSNPTDFGFWVWVSPLEMQQSPQTQLGNKIKHKMSHPKRQPMKIIQTQNPEPKTQKIFVTANQWRLTATGSKQGATSIMPKLV